MLEASSSYSAESEGQGMLCRNLCMMHKVMLTQCQQPGESEYFARAASSEHRFVQSVGSCEGVDPMGMPAPEIMLNTGRQLTIVRFISAALGCC